MKEYSYWLDTINKDFLKVTDLPQRVDVLIVGFGYTGLNAALEIIKAGMSVCVIDKNDFGSGCSSKNGGQISNLLKPSLEKLTKKYGFEKAQSIRGEGVNAVNWLTKFIKSEKIECDFKRDGLFCGAHTPIFFEKIVDECEDLKKHEGIETLVSDIIHLRTGEMPGGQGVNSGG